MMIHRPWSLIHFRQPSELVSHLAAAWLPLWLVIPLAAMKEKP